MIYSSDTPYGLYEQNGKGTYYTIGNNKPSRKTVFFSMLYNKYKEKIKSLDRIFVMFDDEYDLEFAKFLCCIYTSSNFVKIIDINNAVNNYVGGDISLIRRSINKINNDKSVKCCIFIPTERSTGADDVVDTININYKSIKKKVFIMCNNKSRLYRLNKNNIISTRLMPDKTIFPDSSFNFNIVGDISIRDYIEWTNEEDYINKNIMFSGLSIKKNRYGLENTLVAIRDVLEGSRYNIDYDIRNKGLLNCGVEGSGKTYLGQEISDIKGVVTITTFNKQIVDLVSYYNNLWSYNETSLYLVFLDEVDGLFSSDQYVSMFKQLTGSDDFPRNIFIYATSNKDITYFDKSIYRTGRLQYQYWDYLTVKDIDKADTTWIDIVSSNVKIRYVDYMVRRSDFIDDIVRYTDQVYSKGVVLREFNESEDNNRMNQSHYNIFKLFELQEISMKEIEYLSIRYALDKTLDTNKAWCINKKHYDTSINLYKLPFYVFIYE